jgi:hypothetical protein
MQLVRLDTNLAESFASIDMEAEAGPEAEAEAEAEEAAGAEEDALEAVSDSSLKASYPMISTAVWLHSVYRLII